MRFSGNQKVPLPYLSLSTRVYLSRAARARAPFQIALALSRAEQRKVKKLCRNSNNNNNCCFDSKCIWANNCRALLHIFLLFLLLAMQLQLELCPARLPQWLSGSLPQPAACCLMVLMIFVCAAPNEATLFVQRSKTRPRKRLRLRRSYRYSRYRYIYIVEADTDIDA